MTEAGYDENLSKVNILNKYLNTYLLKTATELNFILSGNQPNTVYLFVYFS